MVPSPLALFDLPLHLVVDVITQVVLSADLEVFFENEVTKLISRHRLFSLTRSFEPSFARYDVERDSSEYQLAKSFRLRLVVENLKFEPQDSYLRKFIHRVTSDIKLRMSQTPLPISEDEILRDVCKVTLAHHGCFDLLQRLYSKKFDYNSLIRKQKFAECDKDVSRSSFVVAIACRYIHLQTSMLESNLDVNFQTENFGSPLEAAARFGLVETMQMLLNHTTNDDKGKEIKFLSLYAAANHGQVESVRALLTPERHLGSDPNDWQSNHSASIATRYRHSDITRMILKRDPRSEQSLMDLREDICCEAVVHGMDDILLEMIQIGVDLNAITSLGETPLCIAAISNHFSTVEILLNGGCWLRAMGVDAFVKVATRGNLEMVQHFCKLKAHKSEQELSNSVHSAFCSAAERGHLHITKFLLGEFPNNILCQKTTGYCHGYHTLHGAMRKQQYKMVRWLIQECGLSAKEYPKVDSTISPSPIFDAIDLADTEMMILLFWLGAIPLDMDIPFLYAIFNPNDRTDSQRTKAQELNRRWYDARMLGVKEVDFFSPLESLECTKITRMTDKFLNL